jgi:hypothetical protein
MGCDIHMYVEYRPKKADYNFWNSYGGRINPGRDYVMFGLLCKGVRTSFDQSHLPKGKLKKGEMGWQCEEDLHLLITKDGDREGETTILKALRWSKTYGLEIHRSDLNNEPIYIDHPDWHSHSWLTIEEFEKSLKDYEQIAEELGYVLKEPDVKYSAILSSMKTLENNGQNDVRVVFWFDS